MPARKFSLIFLSVILGWVATVAALTVWQQKVTGDLTRVGRWSEREFGFHNEGYQISTLANEATDNFQVAVLGDSFSRPNIWQSVLARTTGQTIRTWQFEDGASCLKEWALNTVVSHPSVHTIVFETVERKELESTVKLYDCTPDRSTFHTSPSAQLRASRSYWPLTMDLDYLVRSVINGIRQDIWPQAEVRSEVVNVPLNRRGLFSNNREDRVLYYTDDEPGWRASAAAYQLATKNLSELNVTLRDKGVRLVVIIVPDKSNVYRNEMAASRLPPSKIDLAELLQQRGVAAPILLPAFRKQALATVDFYLPDDTHLSLPGFEFLGQTLVSFWRSEAFGARY